MDAKKANLRRLLGIARRKHRAVKSVNEVLREYDNALLKLTIDARNGNIPSGEMSRRHKALLKTFGQRAFLEGLREGGVKNPTLADLDNDDLDKLNEWLGAQKEHTLEFARAAADANDEAKRLEIQRRREMWVGSLRDVGGLGLASAKGNMMVTWEFGDTDHCETCFDLDGQRRRLKWFVGQGYIPRQNGSETLDCGGWNCQCRLIDDSGKQVLPA